MSDDNTLDYVAMAACGCLQAWITLSRLEKDLKERRKFYRAAATHGETITRMMTEDVRRVEWRCAAHKAMYAPHAVKGHVAPPEAGR